MKTARFGALAAAIVLPCLWHSPAAAQQSLAAESFVLQPDSAASLSTPAPRLSGTARDALLSRIEERRETFAREAAERFARESAASATQTNGQSDLTAVRRGNRNRHRPGTDVDVCDQPACAGDFSHHAQQQEHRAEVPGNSSLAAPVAINNRNQVLYAGNFSHLEISTNHGATYSDRAFPAGPADAPTPCCSPDMVIDDATRIGFRQHALHECQRDQRRRADLRSSVNGARLDELLLHDRSGRREQQHPAELAAHRAHAEQLLPLDQCASDLGRRLRAHVPDSAVADSRLCALTVNSSPSPFRASASASGRPPKAPISAPACSGRSMRTPTRLASTAGPTA